MIDVTAFGRRFYYKYGHIIFTELALAGLGDTGAEGKMPKENSLAVEALPLSVM